MESKQTRDSLCGFLAALVVKNLPANAGDIRKRADVVVMGASFHQVMKTVPLGMVE